MFSKVWKGNWTPHWGWLKLGVGTSAVATHYIGQTITNPDVKSAIDALHIDPKWMLVIAVLGAITLLSAEH